MSESASSAKGTSSSKASSTATGGDGGFSSVAPTATNSSPKVTSRPGMSTTKSPPPIAELTSIESPVPLITPVVNDPPPPPDPTGPATPPPESPTVPPPTPIEVPPSDTRRPKTTPPAISVSLAPPTPSTLDTLTSITSTTGKGSKTKLTSSVPAPASTPKGGTPFDSSNEEKGDQPKQGKGSGAKVGAVVGGLSAAILIGVLVFFLWKWRKRGKYRFNKRQSFGPYGNGIDANQGGLLVSAVPAKSGDATSGNGESVYSDDNSPTRYQLPPVDLGREPMREPTLPNIDPPPPVRPYPGPGAMNKPPANSGFNPPMSQSGNPAFNPTSMKPGSNPGFNSPGNQTGNNGYNQPRDQYGSYRPGPEMTMAGMSPMMRPPPSHRQPPVLYDRRRPPVPPSMRRNRSPQFNNGYGPMGPGMSPTHSPRGPPPNGADRGFPQPQPPPQGPPPQPQNTGFAEPGQYMPRSNTISSQMPSRTVEMGQMEPDRNRRVRRSMSLSNLENEFRKPSLDPLSMHPVIPEVPSGATTPMFENGPVDPRVAALGVTHRRSNSLTMSTNRPSVTWDRLDVPRQLIVTNPSPPTPLMDKAKNPMGDMMRRVGSISRPEHKVGDAAKNF